MAAQILHDVIYNKITPNILIKWLTAQNSDELLIFPKYKKEDFVPYFLNSLREQTTRILRLTRHSTLGKLHKNLEEAKSTINSSKELFPSNQNDSDISEALGVKFLDISQEEPEKISKKRIALLSPNSNCGKPLATSSPLAEYQKWHRTVPDLFCTDRDYGRNRDYIRGGKKKNEEIFNNTVPSRGRDTKGRRRINPTQLSSKPRGGDFSFESSSRTLDSNISFQIQPLQIRRSKNISFEEERTLLKQVRQQVEKKMSVPSPAKIVSCVVPDPLLVTHHEELEILANIYCSLIDFNLVLNIMTELCFIMSLLVIQVPESMKFRLLEDESQLYFNTVHNCVYFATYVLNHSRDLLKCFDKITLKMLLDNRQILNFTPDLFKFIKDLLLHDKLKSKQLFLITTPMVQSNVSFQSETDNCHNFPTVQAFHVFRKQRDGLYEILRMWESNHHIPGWSFANALGQKIRTLLNLHNEPANYVHFARLFRSQLLGTCSGSSRCSEPEVFNDNSGALDFLKEVDPDKLSRLHERLVTPVQSSGPCPLPSFPGQQEFYHDFILCSSHPAFLHHLSDSLASEILELNATYFTVLDQEDTETFVDDTTHTSYLTCVSALRLLAKFLGFITFLPYQSNTKVLPENMVTSHAAIRSKLCPQLDIESCINEAVSQQKLVLTLPWVVKFLCMIDPVSAHLPYYTTVFEALFRIYQDTRIIGRQGLLIRLLLGWLFESPNFSEELFYTLMFKQSSAPKENLSHSGKHIRGVPVDTLDVVDEHCLYLCCPYMGELKLSLSIGVGSSAQTIKHITPIPASISPPSQSGAKRLELQLEERFFHGQPASTRKTVEYVAERVASSCVKYLCSKALSSVKQQGAADVATLLSACHISELYSDSAVKDFKESMMKKVSIIADKCCVNFKLFENISKYCKDRCRQALPVLLADETLEQVSTICVDIATRLSQERVNSWIHSHITPGLFIKDFQSDIEKALRNVGKRDQKNESICKSTHVLLSGRRNVNHSDTAASPTQTIIQLRDLMWRMVDDQNFIVNEQLILHILHNVQDTMCNRTDLIPSAEKLLPSLLVDLTVLLVAYNPDIMKPKFIEYFVTVWKSNGDCENLTRLLCPRNVLLLSQSKYPADKVWICMAELLAYLLSRGVIESEMLEQQCIALMQCAWPQTVLNLLSTCFRVVVQRHQVAGESKFALLMEWQVCCC